MCNTNFTPLIDANINPKYAIFMHIYNAILCMEYVPEQWKQAQVIMLLKLGKPLKNVTSYQQISLLPSLSKLLDKLYSNVLSQL